LTQKLFLVPLKRFNNFVQRRFLSGNVETKTPYFYSWHQLFVTLDLRQTPQRYHQEGLSTNSMPWTSKSIPTR
jgi:hypothetical protein